MRVNRSRMQGLYDEASQAETTMTRVALHDVSNPATVRRQLQTAFDTSLRGHESTEQLIKRIQHVADVSRARAATIAQTEKTRAANSARVASAMKEYLEAYDKAVKNHSKRPEPPMMQWVNPRAAREPRPHHVAISGTIKPVGDEFFPGLRYPGDPQGPAHEVINCHCYVRKIKGVG
nr:hypothetical protein [Clostridia bacterium]